MKTFTRALIAGLLSILGVAGTALAQHGGWDDGYGYYDGSAGYGPGGGPAGPAGGYIPSGTSFLHVPLAGTVEFSLNGAARGLGYEGAYASARSMIPLHTDALEGWWLIDSRASISDDGGTFANIGVMRRKHFRPMHADFGLGVYYDVDGDEADDFGHAFQQVGISAHMWTCYFDINFNGYIPVGDTDFNIGTADSPFFENFLLVRHGFDSALRGYDFDFALRPDFLAQHSGTFHVGGYAYRSDNVDAFGGFRGMFSIQPHAGITLSAGVTADEEFDTQGILQIAWVFGSSRGFSTSGRDLDPMPRNAHIVRAHQNAVFASDPDTGLRYNVVHVDNSVFDGGNGTVEDPFNELVDAEAASLPQDIIFVHAGVSTDAAGNPNDLTGYDNGIVLKDGQLFLGEGVVQVIPTIEVGDFAFFAGVPGILPTITNDLGPAVVLADNNIVSGFNIDDAPTGIFGDTVANADIRNNNITDTLNNGVLIQNGTGNTRVTNNRVDNSGANGVFIQDTTGTLVATGNTFTNNGVGIQDGLRVSLNGGGAAAALLANITGNTLDGNGTGLFVGADGAGTVVTAVIADNLSVSNNRANGIEVDSRNGAHLNFAITSHRNITGNGLPTGTGAGIRVGVFDATADGQIADNVLTDNAGATPAVANAAMGIGVSVFGDDGQLDLEIARNIITGTGLAAGASSGDAINLEFDTDNPLLVSTINIHDNFFTDVTQDVIDVDASLQSRADIIVTANAAVLAAGAATNDINGSAFDILVTDDAVVRLTATGNNFSDMNGSAIDLLTFADGRLLANFTGNTFDNNGGNGLTGNVFGDSILVLDFFNNRIVNAGGSGVSLTLSVPGALPILTDSGLLYGFFQGNDISLNGGVQFEAIIESNALFNAELGLSFLNQNVFGAAPELSNLSFGPPDQPFADFIFETDGTNTPPAPIILVPPVVQVPVGTIQAIAAPLRVFP